MIQANELRIGNWIYVVDAGNFQVESLDMYDRDTDPSILVNEEYYLQRCEPIPLTEEWLLKFGFEIGGNHISTNLTTAKIKGFAINTYSNFDEKYWWLGYYTNSVNSHIKYLHQLQNLYFSLTGIELIYNS